LDLISLNFQRQPRSHLTRQVSEKSTPRALRVKI
jgi:hypothetical protein